MNEENQALKSKRSIPVTDKKNQDEKNANEDNKKYTQDGITFKSMKDWENYNSTISSLDRGVPVKAPEHDERKNKVGDVWLGGLLVGSLTSLLLLTALAIREEVLFYSFPVVALGVKWVLKLKGREQSLLHLFSVNLVAFLVTAVVGYGAVFGAPSGGAVFGYYMSGAVLVTMLGAIVGVVVSWPYVIYLRSKNSDTYEDAGFYDQF
jgi:hypothetical protein